MDPVIRPIRSADAAAVSAIHDAAFAPWIETLPAVFGYRPARPDEMARWAEDDDHETWLALRHGEPVGYVRILLEEPAGGDEAARELAFVSTDEHAGQSRIAVHPEHRRRGVGTALVRAVLERYGRVATHWSWAGAYGDNAPAAALLGSLGFRQGRLTTPCPFTVDPHRTDDSVLGTYDLDGPLPDVPLNPAVVVREIEERDADAMCHVFGEARPLVFGPTPTREQVLGWLRGGWGETILVGEIDGEVVGCVEHRSSGVLGIPGVRPAWRRRGVGTTLLVRLLEVMKAKGLRTALGDTGWFDDGAIRLYERLGFDTSRWLRSWVRPPD